VNILLQITALILLVAGLIAFATIILASILQCPTCKRFHETEAEEITCLLNHKKGTHEK